MITDIKYSGYTAQPSDYECPDGDLAVAINLVPEDGCIKSIHAPVRVINMASDEYKIIYIHKSSTYTHYILYHLGTKYLYWVDSSEIVNSVMPASLHVMTSQPVILSRRIISSMGNLLIVSSGLGLSYFIWDVNSYRELPENPFLSLEFGLQQASIKRVSDMADIETPTERSTTGARRFSNTALENITTALYGHILSSQSDYVKSGWFLMPFFVRYAFRLFDDSYIWQSAPVLLFPTLAPPKVEYESDYDQAYLTETTKFKFGYNLELSKLAFRIVDKRDESYRAWEPLIRSIDVFVSAPIYTWDQSAKLKQSFSTSWGQLASQLYRNPSANGTTASNEEDSSASATDSRSGSSPSGNVRPPHNGGGTDNTGFSELESDDFFLGHNGNLAANYGFRDVIGNKNDSTSVYAIPRNENFHKQIVSNANFYKIATLPFNEISFSDNFRLLNLDNADLTNLQTRETLPDDYQSHCKLQGSALYVYNSRLNVGCVDLTPPIPYPFRSLAPAVFEKPSAETLIGVRVRVWLKKNGVIYTVSNPDNTGNPDSDPLAVYSNQYLIESTKDHFPRWVYYPDANAYKMQIQFSNGESYTIPLTPHDFLNGAYYYGSFNVDPRPPIDTEDSALTEYEQKASLIIPRHNAIYTSEVNNPLYFPILGINTVGDGRIIGLCSAAKALSQGQFGQFPLYAFTDEGVWAMELNTTGFYSARQPITRDVCINPDAITQIDSSALFPTHRGIMMISGSVTQSISDIINAQFPFDLRSLPLMQRLHDSLNHDPTIDRCLPLLPFTDFLTTCRMVYDYVHQRIIVYNPAVTYAYVYSLKSGAWGMIYSDIADNVNSYPNALIIDSHGNLADFSLSDDSDVASLLVTRPLKLDAADVLKTVDTIIQRGNFSKGHVQSVLYGSRDLTNWHLVWSSRDHYLRGFRGTPYKYFRIALLCNLAANESIYGCTVQYQPRLTNQPR